jgi:hypothetical protein
MSFANSPEVIIGIRQPDDGCILFDPQCDIAEKGEGDPFDSGLFFRMKASWDQGDEGIRRFVRTHWCGDTCVALGLRAPGTLTPKPIKQKSARI